MNRSANPALPASFDLFSTYVFLKDGGAAAPIDATGSFWPDLMSGNYQSAGARLVGEGDGWLVSAYHTSENTAAWERHPAGDEIILVLRGAIAFIFEEAAGERIVELRAGAACVVPRGVWHRQIVHEPSDYLALTYGKGTEHRPVG